MYCEKLVACVKVDNKIVRDDDGKVYLPFGTDYTLYLKNLHTCKARIGIEIDGRDVLNNHRILIDPGESVDLEGFIENDLGQVRNKFRFIEKTQQISDYRGDRAEDGLIYITYQFANPYQITYTSPYNPTIDFSWHNDSIRGSSATPTALYCTAGSHTQQKFTSVNCNTPNNKNGITVPGKQTNQDFHVNYDTNIYGSKFSMVIQLFGCVKNEKVEKVCLTRKKIKCPTCGTKNKSNVKYCGNCGTFVGV